MNAFDPSLRMGGWMRLGNRANEGYAELSVCIYLPDGSIACQFQRPAIAGNDAFDAGGLRYECLEPFRRCQMTYEGELLLLFDPEQLRDPASMFEHAPRVPGAIILAGEGISPVHGGEPTGAGAQTLYGPEFSRGHFNQHTAVTGSIRVGDREWTIDGRGWRDHSWGPRFWQAIYAYRLLLGNVGEDGFMLLKNIAPDGRARRLGVLLVDGRYEEVVDLDVVTHWGPQADPEVVEVAVATESRRERITGRVITLAPLRNRRRENDQTLVSRVAEGFTEFTWGDRKGYGMIEYVERVIDSRPVGYPL